MKFIGFIQGIFLGLHKSIKRFPVTIALSTSVVTIMIIISEIQRSSGYSNPVIETYTRIAMVLALGVPLSLCIKLFFEKNRNINSIVKVIVWSAAAMLLVIYYFFLLKEFRTVQISRYIALSLALYLAFLFTPYLGRKENYEFYVIKLFTRFFITIIYSLVLFLGIAAILFTIDKLLAIYIKETIYYYTWLITAGVFAPIFFLGGVPEIHENLDDYEYPKFLKILLLYIVMPLITIYLSILYIYFGKIIITQKWPIGLVSHLVLWYSALCVIVIFFISPIRNNPWVEKFIFWFPKVILPILLMMFVSMGIRIKAYGITENRYYVVLLGLWIIAMMLYYNLRKIKHNIILPVSLSIIALISVFGPISSFSVSKLSQNNRFSKILLNNQMLDETKQIKAKPDISEKDRKEISSILDYFERIHSLKDLKYIPENFKISDMERVFGFSFSSYNPYAGNDIYLNYNIIEQNEPVNISGYDYLLDFRNFKGQVYRDGLKMVYNYEGEEIRILFKDKEIYKMHLSDFGNKIYSKYGNTNAINQQDMMYEDENQYIKVKFIFFYINGVKDINEDLIRIKSADFYTLIKLKS